MSRVDKFNECNNHFINKESLLCLFKRVKVWEAVAVAEMIKCTSDDEADVELLRKLLRQEVVCNKAFNVEICFCKCACRVNWKKWTVHSSEGKGKLILTLNLVPLPLQWIMNASTEARINGCRKKKKEEEREAKMVSWRWKKIVTCQIMSGVISYFAKGCTSDLALVSMNVWPCYSLSATTFPSCTPHSLVFSNL